MRSLTFNTKLPLNIISLLHAIFILIVETSSNPVLSTIVSTRYCICYRFNFILDPKLFAKGLTSKLRKSEAINYCFAEREPTTATTHNEKERINRRKGNIEPWNKECVRANSLHGKARRKIYIRPITRVTIERDIGAGEHGQRIKRALSHDSCIEQR